MTPTESAARKAAARIKRALELVHQGEPDVGTVDFEAIILEEEARAAACQTVAPIPRCPKCKTESFGVYMGKAQCGSFDCQYEGAASEFFQPAPSPPQTCLWAMMKNGKVTMRCRLPQGHIPEDAHDYVAVASPQGETNG